MRSYEFSVENKLNQLIWHDAAAQGWLKRYNDAESQRIADNKRSILINFLIRHEGEVFPLKGFAIYEKNDDRLTHSAYDYQVNSGSIFDTFEMQPDKYQLGKIGQFEGNTVIELHQTKQSKIGEGTQLVFGVKLEHMRAIPEADVESLNEQAHQNNIRRIA